MLERTAGRLESGSLRRLLPSSRKSLKSRRTLHSAFWNHGGGDLELSPLWAALLRGPDPVDQLSEQQQQNKLNGQNGVLLDFLYPAGTINFIRQFSGWGLDRQDARRGRAGFGRLGHRLYTSAAKDLNDSSAGLTTEAQSVVHRSGISSEEAVNGGQGTQHNTQFLKELMESETRPVYEEVWRHYTTLPDSDQVQLRTQLMKYLSTSTRVRDAERITALFEDLPSIARDRNLYKFAIQSYCKLRNHPRAISLHKEALARFDFPAGSSELLTHLIDHSLWSQALETWKDYQAFKRQFPRMTGIYNLWASLRALPNFPAQALAFAEYVDKIGIFSTSPHNDMTLNTLDLEGTPDSDNTDFTGGHKPVVINTADEVAPCSQAAEDIEALRAVRAVRDIEPAQDVARDPQAAPSLAIADTAGLSTFAVIVINEALFSGDMFDATLFVALLGKLRQWGVDTPTLYQNAVDHLLRIGQSKLAIRIYRKGREAGRWVPNGLPGRDTLHSLLSIFCGHHSILGMQQILDDWFKCFGGPSRLTYLMCMREFASQGDATTVHALFEQYTIRFRIRRGVNMLRADDIAPLLHVHAKRGELSEVVMVFNEIKEKYGSKPTIRCWNILLSAYGKARDIDGAIQCFQQILESDDVKADDYSYGTIMGIYATRGDLECVLEVYHLADSQGVRKSTAMVDCIVLVLAKDDDLLAAERICDQALHMKLSGSKTRMWNYMLLAYAMRRDLTNVNRILQKMSSEKVEYDAETYSALMQALAMTKMPERAYTILKEVMPEAGIQVTNFHYAIAMGGFLATRNVKRVFEVHNRMTKRAMPESVSTRLQTIRTVAVAEETTQGTEEIYQGAKQLFKNMISSMDAQERSDTLRKGHGDLPLELVHPTSLYGFIMFVLAKANDFSNVKELYEEFSSAIFKDRQNEIPIPILVALMIMQLGQGDHDAVKELWELALSQATAKGRGLPRLGSKSKRPKILYSHQLDLGRALSLYLDSLAKQKHADELIYTVTQVTEMGFELSNRTRNHYVQLLARLFRYKAAFKECEDLLMPNWTGWQRLRWQQPVRNRLPLELRNMRKLPRVCYPHYRTMLYLARGYIELEGVFAERGHYSLMLELERDCPKTTQAIKTMPRTDEYEEREILRL